MLYSYYIIFILLNCIILQKNLFDKVLNSAGKTGVKNMKIDVSDLEQYEQIYIDALKALKTESTSIVSTICIILLNSSYLLIPII